MDRVLSDRDLAAALRKLDGAGLASVLAEMLNILGKSKGREVGAALVQEHRTLQQNVIRFLLEIIYGYGETVGDWVDPRNEGAAQFAKQLKAAIDDGSICAILPII